MKKLINKKHESGENGIAILFSLIMLMIFFIIAFGFVSMASTSRDAALARAPAATASLSANESIFNEVFVVMETELISDGIVDASKLETYTFTNGTDTVDVQMYGTRGDTTGIGDVFMQILSAGDYYAGGGGSFGWIEGDGTFGNADDVDLDGDGADDDRYAWMVIESNGVDPNYIGGKSTGLVTGVRNGEYVRELDIGVVDPSFRDGQTNSVYVDWSAATPSPWEDKKSLLNSLSAAVVESAITLFEPNTSPVTIGEIPNSRFDLCSDPTGTLSSFIDNISWFSSAASSTARNQAAANLKDFIDSDNEATSELGVVGNERVPYLNEVKFIVTNNTEAPNASAADASQHQSPTEIELSMETPEIINMFNTTAWGNPATGVSGRIIVSGSITAERTDAVLTEAFSFTFDNVALNGGPANGYHQPTVGTAPLPLSLASTTESQEPSAIEVTIKVNSIILYGDNGTTLWDQATLDTSSDMTSSTIIVTQGDNDDVSFEAINPRDNYKDWRWNAWGADTLMTKNTAYSAPSEEDSSAEPWEWTTAYMPVNGQIRYLSEVGLCARDGSNTFNLVDYNAAASTAFGAYKPTGVLTLGNTSTFNGGDRSLLDYVYLSVDTGAKTSAGGGLPEYKQYGAINPNTSNRNILKMLLSGISAKSGPESGVVANDDTLSAFITNFPGIEASATTTEYFLFDQFKDSNNSHNRNPTMYGYAFSDAHPSPVTVAGSVAFTDPLKEALVVNSMKLVSPKYSYFTILIAVDLNKDGADSRIRLFVRRDNENGSYKIMKKSEQ